MYKRRSWYRRGGRSGGCSCGGCGCLLLAILFAIVWVLLVQQRSTDERWIADPSMPEAVQTIISDLIRIGTQLWDSLLRLVGS